MLPSARIYRRVFRDSHIHGADVTDDTVFSLGLHGDSLSCDREIRADGGFHNGGFMSQIRASRVRADSLLPSHLQLRGAALLFVSKCSGGGGGGWMCRVVKLNFPPSGTLKRTKWIFHRVQRVKYPTRLCFIEIQISFLTLETAADESISPQGQFRSCSLLSIRLHFNKETVWDSGRVRDNGRTPSSTAEDHEVGLEVWAQPDCWSILFFWK